MPDLALTYRGYTIRWSDNEDCWVCYDAGKGINNVSLLKLKEAIDRLNRKERKDAALSCFEIDARHNAVEKVEASLIEYLGPKIERAAWHENKPPQIVGHKVASVALRGGNSQASRRETTLDKFMPDTPEAHEAFHRAELAAAMVREANAVLKLAVGMIPRVSIEEIQKLVELHEADKGT